jgi:hypothetical protein
MFIKNIDSASTRAENKKKYLIAKIVLDEIVP